jgi:hypothetical protein
MRWWWLREMKMSGEGKYGDLLDESLFFFQFCLNGYNSLKRIISSLLILYRVQYKYLE